MSADRCRRCMKTMLPHSCLVLLSLLLLTIPGCSYVYELLLTGQVLRGDERVAVAGAKVALFTGNYEHCTTTTDSEGRWSLKTSLSDIDFWSDEKGRLWLKSDPPYPKGAPKAKYPYKIRVETEEGLITCPIPNVSVPDSGGEITASMLILVEGSFVLPE